MGRASVRPAARRDLIQHFAYIGENSSLATARRFETAARATFAELTQSPGMGRSQENREVSQIKDVADSWL